MLCCRDTLLLGHSAAGALCCWDTLLLGHSAPKTLCYKGTLLLGHPAALAWDTLLQRHSAPKTLRPEDTLFQGHSAPGIPCSRDADTTLDGDVLRSEGRGADIFPRHGYMPVQDEPKDDNG